MPAQAYGFLGNLPDIDPSFATRSLWCVTQRCDSTYQLTLSVLKPSLSHHTSSFPNSVTANVLKSHLWSIRRVAAHGLKIACSRHTP